MMNSRAGTLPDVVPSRTARKSTKTAVYWAKWFLPLSLVVWAGSFVIGFELALTILMLASLAAAVMGLRWPALGLIGIGVQSALDPIARILLLGTSNPLMRFNTLNFWLLFVMLLWMPFLLRLNDLHTRLMQILLVLLGIGLLITPVVEGGLQHLLNVVTLFGLICYFARAADDLTTLYWVGVVVGVTAAAGNMAYYLQESGLAFINPNSLSYLPLTGLFCICLGFRFAATQWQGQPILLILGVVNFICVFLSTSRGSLLVAVACMLFLTMQIPNASRRLLFIVAGVLLGLAISSQFTELQEQTVTRLEKLINPELSATQRTSKRSDIILYGWYTFLDYPLGIGTGGYVVAGSGGTGYQAHSAWIKILVENGVQGFLALAGYILSFAIVGWNKRRQGMFTLGLLVTVVLSTAFMTSEFQGKGLWLLAAGVTLLLHREMITTHMRRATGRGDEPYVVRRGQ